MMIDDDYYQVHIADLPAAKRIVGRWLDEIDSRIEREVKGGNHGA